MGHTFAHLQYANVFAQAHAAHSRKYRRLVLTCTRSRHLCGPSRSSFQSAYLLAAEHASVCECMDGSKQEVQSRMRLIKFAGSLVEVQR